MGENKKKCRRCTFKKEIIKFDLCQSCLDSLYQLSSIKKIPEPIDR